MDKEKPTYTRGKRSVRSHEPIFHFVKSPEFYYNDQWLHDIEDVNAKLDMEWTRHTQGEVWN
jgi:hypothetical protein